MEWANLTPKSLWTQIKLELKSYYDWDLQADSLESMVEQFSVQKISLLRYILHFAFCFLFLKIFFYCITYCAQMCVI
jgi:hypothetical protein